ncbi:heterokaryon incompatibility protein-domain-containing protein [Annulohypoxylon moriforme]|nr:heterokaryon incompatibility protein-domain-containing protein [Annulohypoxylon moriforme]
MGNPDDPLIYRPLSGSEIRLILVYPGLSDDLIRCELTYVDLEENPGYCALSYVWGDPNHTKNIEVNGKVFPVTINLYDALYRYRRIQTEEFLWRNKWAAAKRHTHRPNGFWWWDKDVLDRCKSKPPTRSLEATLSDSLVYQLLWVDAICINQQDVDERNREIPRMRDIFSLASSTVAWLGKAASLKQKRDIDRIIDISDELMSLLKIQDGENMKLPIIADRRMFAELAYQLFENILNRSWFKRIWVVQEVVLSKTTLLMIEDRIMSIDSLSYLQKTFASETNTRALPIVFCGLIKNNIATSMVSLMHRFGPHASPPEGIRPTLDSFADTLYAVLEHGISIRQATDEHDMIYGVLGMTKLPELPGHLIPDYRVPYEVVFWHYFRFLIERTGDLRCLGWKMDMVPGAPTWVPDLKRVGVTPEKGPRSIVSFCTNGRCMTVEGWPFGTCVKTVRYPRSAILEEEFYDLLNNFNDGILKPWSQVKGLPLSQAVAQWVKIGCERVLTEYFFSFQCLEICFKMWTHKQGTLLFDLVSRYLQSPEEKRYIKAMQEVLLKPLVGKSFFVTEGGYLGYLHSSKTIEVFNGDVVCALKGWYFPCILRPLGEELFMFIKNCEIHNEEFDTSCFKDWWETRTPDILTLI